MTQLLHSIANYPTSFKGTVVSPTKICLQFEGVESKLRVMEGAEYIKMPDLSAGYTIKHTGSPVDVLAVGCQMPTLEALQQALIDAYVKYGRLHSERYREEYGAEFMDFILRTQAQINNAIDKLKER